MGCIAGLRSDRAASSRGKAASPPTEIRAAGGRDDEEHDSSDGSPAGAACCSVRDALTLQGTARHHAAGRRVKGGGAAAAAAAHALKTKLAAAEARMASAEAGAAGAQASAAASRVLETKLAAAEARAVAESGPAMVDNSPLRATDVVFHDHDANRHPNKQIEGHDGGLWDNEFHSDDDGELDEEENCMAFEQSAAAAAAACGRRPQLRWMIDDDYHAELCTSVLTRREKSPSPPAPDDASATGRTYDDIIEAPPPHLRCVVSPHSSLSPAPRCTAASLPSFFFADVPGLGRV